MAISFIYLSGAYVMCGKSVTFMNNICFYSTTNIKSFINKAYSNTSTLFLKLFSADLF